MKYNEEQRKQIAEVAKGKTVESLEWCEGIKGNGDGIGYWVMTFTSGEEVCFRLMAELI